MTKHAPEIAQLRLDIESAIHRKIRTPYDFELLSDAIWDRLHEHMSPTTLKRLWGYINGAEIPRWTTLSLLSQFLGFKNWDDYLTRLTIRDDIESEAFRSRGIVVDELCTGDEIEVTWLPNRTCHFRYEGNRRFVVTEAKNAKLHVGDTFSAAAFFVGQPMYLDQIESSASSGMSYVAGKRNGLLTVQKI